MPQLSKELPERHPSQAKGHPGAVSRFGQTGWRLTWSRGPTLEVHLDAPDHRPPCSVVHANLPTASQGPDLERMGRAHTRMEGRGSLDRVRSKRSANGR